MQYQSQLMKLIKKIKKEEYYIYDDVITNRTQDRDIQNFSFSLFTMTNYSNVSWTKGIISTQYGIPPVIPIFPKNIEFNFPLHDIFIDVSHYNNKKSIMLIVLVVNGMYASRNNILGII